MSLKNTIDKLFEDDLLGRQEQPPENEGLQSLDTTRPIEEALRAEGEEPVRHEGGGIEQRQFHRADVQPHQLELKFLNQQQFAKQYIENISMGGLFVRTEQKFKAGQIVPINFRIPAADSNQWKDFSLHARVCRIRDNGVGLEFTNLTEEKRLDLESFIKQTLPQGLEIHTKAKQSTLDRLKAMREAKAAQKKRMKRRSLQTLTIVILLALNGVFMTEFINEPAIQSEYKERKLELDGRTVYLTEIKSISKNKEGEILLNLQNDEAIPLPKEGIERDLPYHLRHSYHLLQKVEHRKPKRKSKTSERHTRLR